MSRTARSWPNSRQGAGGLLELSARGCACSAHDCMHACSCTPQGSPWLCRVGCVGWGGGEVACSRGCCRRPGRHACSSMSPPVCTRSLWLSVPSPTVQASCAALRVPAMGARDEPVPAFIAAMHGAPLPEVYRSKQARPGLVLQVASGSHQAPP